MNKTITHRHQTTIARMIGMWPEKEAARWDLICEASEPILGYIPTRQALSKKPVIKQAYQRRKEGERRRYDKLSGISVPKSMPDAIDRLVRLNSENESLKADLVSIQEMVTRFIHNAYLHGIKKEDLMRPLGEVNRVSKD